MSVESEIALLHRQHETLLRRCEAIEKRWAALQSLDVNFHGPSKLILCAHTEKGDRIKIIDLDEKMSWQDMEIFVREIEEKYGAKIHSIDAPPSARGNFNRMFRY